VLYLDGVKAAEKGTGYTHAPSAPPTGTPFRIGRQYGTYGEYWDGLIDDLRIYGKELTHQEVKGIYHGMAFKYSTGPEDYMVECSGNGLQTGGDLLGPRNDRYGRPKWIDFSGSVDNAISSSRFDHSLARLNGAMGNGTAQFTMSAWLLMDPAEWGTYDSIFYLRGEDGKYASIYNFTTAIGENLLYAQVYDGTGMDQWYYGPFADQSISNKWIHVALVYNTTASGGGEATMYINGRPADLTESSTLATGDLGKITGLYMGSSVNDHFFDGVIDDVHLYARTLSAEEVFQDMAGGANARDRTVTVHFGGTTMAVNPALTQFPYQDGTAPTVEMIAKLYTENISIPGKNHKYPVDGVAVDQGVCSQDVCYEKPCGAVPTRTYQRTWAEAENYVLSDLETDDGRIILNITGFSRGGASTFVLAHNVQLWPPISIRVKHINILAFDPVPGQFDYCINRDAFDIGPLVQNLVIFYMRDERYGYYDNMELLQADMRPIDPTIQMGNTITKRWNVLIPGAHETGVGNAQLSGHNLPTIFAYCCPVGGLCYNNASFNPCVNWSFYEPFRYASYITNIIAYELFESKQWGNVTFNKDHFIDDYDPGSSYTYTDFKDRWNKTSDLSIMAKDPWNETWAEFQHWGWAHLRTIANVSGNPSGLMFYGPGTIGGWCGNRGGVTWYILNLLCNDFVEGSYNLSRGLKTNNPALIRGGHPFYGYYDWNGLANPSGLIEGTYLFSTDALISHKDLSNQLRLHTDDIDEDPTNNTLGWTEAQCNEDLP